ncbi:MAG: type I restriction-modification system subunit M N-terminal domain-containing protein [Desulfatiglandaceae bacterium]
MTHKNGNGANLGFENQMWAAADKLRGHMDASEYKHVVLGLIFLKYISDAFQAKYKQLDATKDTEYTDAEDRDEYAAANIFWVPKEARWAKLQASAKQPTIGKIVDDAMVAIEKENPTLKGVLPKDYSRPSLDKYRLGELIDIISKIGLGDDESRSKDILGRVYEYFLGRFAAAEGKGGGEFYTPRCVVNLLVRMIEPYKGRVYDPCCGSGGMFVQSERFVKEHGYVLTPGRYVGAAEIEDDGVPFEEKIAELSATLYEQFAESERLEAVIKKNLEVLGYGVE